MIGAFVIAFREVIEAGLIVGIVLAATRGIAGRGRWIALGILGGLAGAALVALFAEKISDAFEGAGQEILNAAVLIVAVLMLIWHNTWMAKHGREMAGDLRAAGEAVRTGQSAVAGLALVVGAAILREGAELVLFLYGLVASGTSGPDIQFGALAGVAVGAAMSSVSYFGLAAIPTRYVFSVTSALIILLAAGLAAQAAQFLTNAGLITILDRPLWNTSAILREDSLVGRVLHALVGYTDRPSTMQVLVYLGTILVMVGLMQWTSAGKPRTGKPRTGKPRRLRTA